jgi:hypothetical protein
MTVHNIIKCEIEGNSVKVINGGKTKILTFPFPIRQAISFPKCHVIRFEPEVGETYNENVFGLSLDGDILWQIEPIGHVYADSPYTGMGQVGDLIQLWNWDGVDLFVEPYTGKIVRKSYGK